MNPLFMPSVKTAKEPGPFDTASAARVVGLDTMIAAEAKNRKDHFGHYMLNPFVPGPLSEGLERLVRRYHASTSTSSPMAYLVPPLGTPGMIAAMAMGDEDVRAKARHVVQQAHLKKQSSEDTSITTEKQAALNLLHQMDTAEGGYTAAELQKTAGLMSGALGAAGGYFAGGGNPLAVLGGGAAGYYGGLGGALAGTAGAYIGNKTLTPEVMQAIYKHLPEGLGETGKDLLTNHTARGAAVGGLAALAGIGFDRAMNH